MNYDKGLIALNQTDIMDRCKLFGVYFIDTKMHDKILNIFRLEGF